MKKSFLKLALAVLTVGLFGSCSKINERLDNLEKKVDGIENEQIASINSQISGITSSISDLGQIRSDISSLKQSASDHSVDIFNLEEADRALADRIVNLEDYLDDVLPNYAEKEWVEATFSTLEQYEATCDAIAEIDAKIGTTSEKLSKDIKACADSLTKWVNKQFEGYYTAAQMDAKLAQMKSAIDSAKASGGITDAKADSIASELTNAKAAVDTAKANIRKEYRAAIDTAIKTSEGKLTKALQDAITEVNGKIESLTTSVGKLETSVADLKGRVDKLEEMIQSVTIVPAYSDGSVEVKDDTLSIDFAVTPKDAMSELSKTDVKILLNKVQTKAVALDTVPADSIKVFTKDTKNGTVSLKALIKENLEKLGNNCSLTVAVNVRNDISNFTTKFVPVTVPVSVSLDKHSIVVPYRTLDSIVTLTATVKNAKNTSVNWTSSEHCTSVDGTGKVTITANKFGKDTVVVKTVEGNATDTCFITVLPKGALAGEFSVSATKKVRFSQGNLVATIDATGAPTAWKFSAHQYEYIGANVANTKIGQEAGDVDFFGWSTDAASNNWGIHTKIKATKNFTTGNFKDWGKAVGDGNTWRTLSKNEWTYLFNNHSKKWATVNGVKGYVIAPDGFAGTLSDTYADDAALAADNLVFLPAAGDRAGSSVTVVGSDGFYWSSTKSGSEDEEAYDLHFTGSSVKPNRTDKRCIGCSVRLVTDVK